MAVLQRRRTRLGSIPAKLLAVVKLYSPFFKRCFEKKYHISQTKKDGRRSSKFKARKRAGLIEMTAAPNTMALSSIPLEKSVPSQDTWKENLNLQVICPDCKEVPPNLIEEFSSGDVVCDSCGLVLGDRIIDTRSEWRTFSNDDQANDDPSRVGDGANPLLNGSQLSTHISFGDKGSNRSRDLHRAQNKSTHDKSTKSLLAAYKEIGALGDSMSLPPNVTDTAKHLFKMVNDAGAFKGKSQEAVIAGCIFIACRQCNAGRTFREIYNVTNVPKADIGRIFKKLQAFFAKQNKDRREAAAENGGESLRTCFAWKSADGVRHCGCHGRVAVALFHRRQRTRHSILQSSWSE